MKGFFGEEELGKFSVNRQGITACSKCGLYRHCNSPKMPLEGQGAKSILIVGDFPRREDDATAHHLSGSAGKELDFLLRKVGVNMERDCWRIAAVNCRPPQDHKGNEVDHCRPMVWKQIYDLQPRLILLLGDKAIESMLSHRWARNLPGIGGMRGLVWPDQESKCWVAPIFHPSWILKQKRDEVAKLIWLQDVANAMKQLHEPLPDWQEMGSCVEVIKTEEKALDLIEKLTQKPTKYLAFDYETTGLKPYDTGHQLVCVSLAITPTKCFSFMLTPVINSALAKLLETSRSRKIASNIKFEDTWTHEKLGVRVRNWYWDTMLAAHVLDQRRGNTSIKFQGFVRYGILNYEGDIGHYLKGTKEEKSAKGANAINTVLEAPVDDLLLYCGMDSILEFRVAVDQMREMGVAL